MHVGFLDCLHGLHGLVLLHLTFRRLHSAHDKAGRRRLRDRCSSWPVVTGFRSSIFNDEAAINESQKTKENVVGNDQNGPRPGSVGVQFTTVRGINYCHPICPLGVPRDDRTVLPTMQGCAEVMPSYMLPNPHRHASQGHGCTGGLRGFGLIALKLRKSIRYDYNING